MDPPQHCAPGSLAILSFYFADIVGKKRFLNDPQCLVASWAARAARHLADAEQSAFRLLVAALAQPTGHQS